MPSEYTPSMTEVRAVWCAFSEYGGLVDRPHSGLWDDRLAEFDRAMAAHDEQVRAAERERCAQIAEAMGPVDMALAGSHAGHDVAAAIRAVPAEQKEGN